MAVCELPSDACGLRQNCGGCCGLQGLKRWAGSAHPCGGVRRPRATPMKNDRSNTAAAAAVDVHQARAKKRLLRRRRSGQPVATGKPFDSLLQAASQPACTHNINGVVCCKCRVQLRNDSGLHWLVLSPPRL